MFPQFDKLIDSEFESNCRLLRSADFANAASAVRRLTRLRECSRKCESTTDCGRHTEPLWFQTLTRIFLEAPSPAAVLWAVDDFVQRTPDRSDAFRLFTESPRSLEVLARIACGSPFLTQTLLDQPEALRELITEGRTAAMKSREDFVAEARAATGGQSTSEDPLSLLRRFQRREILRIGMCDAFGLLDLKFVTLQISLLADAMVQLCLAIACDESQVESPPFSVIALGKHGGEELNYSSDIDLVFVGPSNEATVKIARRLIVGLSQKMNTGFLYRVDLRLRPWGEAGALVYSPDTYEAYLQNDAEAWEKQALLKARVVAGATEIGRNFLQRLPLLIFDVTEHQVLQGVRSMKDKIESRLKKIGQLETEVKLGSGSIRDVEFLVQALQLIHGKSNPRLASPNTLDALIRLAEFGVLDAGVYRQLREGYIFLRTVEHALQLLHNQQTHELPAKEAERNWLARRLDYPDSAVLLARFNEHRRAIRRAFDDLFRVSRSSQLLEATPFCRISEPNTRSELAMYFQGHDSAARCPPSELLTDVDANAICRVQVSIVEEGGSGFVVVIATSGGAGIVSLICGVFFANQLDIREGDALHGPGRNRFGHMVPVDQFLGVFLCRDLSPSRMEKPAAVAALLEDELCKLLMMQQTGQESEVRAILLEMFCSRVSQRSVTQDLADNLSVSVSESIDSEPNVMEISADDSTGFLFEVSNALSICGFRVRHAEVGELNGRINDRLHVTENDGLPVCRTERLEELTTAVTLIKRFTNWLPSASDPHQALLRFRDLLHQLLNEAHWQHSVATLKQPDALQTVSRVLGVSRYLWEDFLRVKPATRLPLLTDPERLRNGISRDNLQREILSLQNGEVSTKERRRRLNEFKDYHLFRIDLRHVLGFCDAFGVFSAEITELAEVVVESACNEAFDTLSSKHGTPKRNDGSDCRFAIAALGKFGGVEMGFASDIEMFLVFEEDCETDGEIRISASLFFERTVQLISESIQSRHKGIFEIDLRMRPYGQAGSPAISVDSFRSYFAVEGDAWLFERQSLVKLRCVCGTPEFAESVLQQCHSVTYGATDFDFDILRATREKQIRQLVRGGTINAKLSSGGLVDCEYAVQALQMTFGGTEPQLRTPNTLAAIDAAHSIDLLTDEEHWTATKAYTFLRQLIDCLRMGRGNAQDLTVPSQESPDFERVVRRMQTVHDCSLCLETVDRYLADVRNFAARVERICREREIEK